jgi:hypothetical protein
MKMRIGTACFVNEDAAVRYYRDQNFTREDVRRKASEGEISFGKPTLKDGERLIVVDNGTRYAIEWDE